MCMDLAQDAQCLNTVTSVYIKAIPRKLIITF